ncbi:MAG: transglycosylase domain-containing protein [Pyrinomonadaceae bacterium]|nr:transglycosylase domain-containing protein [Pyrinomonadaceae bacterium]
MRKARVRRKSPIRRIVRLFVLVGLGVAIGFVGYQLIVLARVARLRSENPGTTSLIDARAEETRTRGQEPRPTQVWLPLDRMSPNLQRAILAGEDTNFVTHNGFDYQAIQKAWDEAQRAAAKEARAEGDNESDWLPYLPDFKRGASTITQQLAKNLYLSADKTFIRKGQEAIITIFLERMLTKRRILEIYLNVIEWGDGIYGAEAAARYYFRKSAASLSAGEAAFLSAIIPNPRTLFNPKVNPRRVARRQRIILRGIPYVKLP